MDKRRHAIIQRKIINFDKFDPGAVMCAWDDCERPGYELYKVPTRRGVQTMTYVFCTERHRQYWIAAGQGPETAARNQGRVHGMLPPGHRPTL